MSKLEEKIETYVESAQKLGLDLDRDYIAAVTKALGPSIYNKDAETVSCSDSGELETVKKNFARNKLGVTDDAAIDAAIQKVCETLGSSNRNKYRALFYALLAKELGKTSVYA